MEFSFQEQVFMFQTNLEQFDNVYDIIFWDIVFKGITILNKETN